ncbi:hypothetical protein COO60DRAFT_1466923 [Scenedesmus sp. NREL 46B-D3]|nr:hypothetical protein COO60DRAFT_1466923 [Scenedesmus sp. NREL 46B-D3]
MPNKVAGPLGLVLAVCSQQWIHVPFIRYRQHFAALKTAEKHLHAHLYCIKPPPPAISKAVLPPGLHHTSTSCHQRAIHTAVDAARQRQITLLLLLLQPPALAPPTSIVTVLSMLLLLLLLLSLL